MSRRARSRLTVIVLAAVALCGGALYLSSATAQNSNKAKDRRYSHSQHEKLNVKHNNCKVCHTLDSDYNVMPATLGKNHQPCNNENCHASEFMSANPSMCYVCHDDVDPNVKQQPVVRRRKDSEFGGDLSHKSHTKKVKSAGGVNGACVTCHGDVYKGQKAGKSGHAACSECHGKSSSPSMGTCSGCHRLGSKQATSGAASGDWSVRAMFSHTSHGNDPRSRKTTTKCLECHQEIAEATNLETIKNPKMEYCDGCHDGKNAFKTTGFGCYNCHGEGSK